MKEYRVSRFYVLPMFMVCAPGSLIFTIVLPIGIAISIAEDGFNLGELWYYILVLVLAPILLFLAIIASIRFFKAPVRLVISEKGIKFYNSPFLSRDKFMFLEWQDITDITTKDFTYIKHSDDLGIDWPVNQKWLKIHIDNQYVTEYNSSHKAKIVGNSVLIETNELKKFKSEEFFELINKYLKENNTNQ